MRRYSRVGFALFRELEESGVLVAGALTKIEMVVLFNDQSTRINISCRGDIHLRLCCSALGENLLE